jgi:hypothetical protein
VEVFDYAAHVLSEEFAKNRYRCDSCLEFLDRHGALALDVLAGPLYWRLAVVQTPEGDQYVERLTTNAGGRCPDQGRVPGVIVGR